ncbi:hypothetical protein WICPIJ_002103 [Wickerhamomyces pijperi]|uniref:RNA polymerase II subunit B1 CTD phosphatase RPAP2 homolog n=1 Tax=Wickerhamomyces pijperi TaxID=599730 RepID=A0A9P8Q9M6_WICPI|nr:hypothetical protein WICPIJ_002103 [Wickerhamomyces pijperi]
MTHNETLQSFQTTLQTQFPQHSHQGTGSNALHPTTALHLTLHITELLSDSTTDKNLLKYLSRFITPGHYDEISQERVINKFCAYPLCSASPSRVKDVMSRSFTKSKMLPYAYLNEYCSKYHYQCSVFYRAQLEEEALFSRGNTVIDSQYGSLRYEINLTLLEEVVERYHFERRRHFEAGGSPEDVSMKDILRGLRSLNLGNRDADVKEEAKVSDMTALFEEFEIIEREDIPLPQEVDLLRAQHNRDSAMVQESGVNLEGLAIDGYVFGSQGQEVKPWTRR